MMEPEEPEPSPKSVGTYLTSQLYVQVIHQLITDKNIALSGSQQCKCFKSLICTIVFIKTMFSESKKSE